MLKRTHEAFSGVFWLGGTLVVNLASYRTTGDMAVNTGIALVGTVCVIPTSAGKQSPDIDHIWWPGFPKKGYPLWGHRGITHRFWFASLLTTPFLILTLLLHDSGLGWAAPLSLTLPAGWWSHLLGDMIYGRLRILGHSYGLGWTTGGISETGKRKNGGRRYVIDPAAKVCTGITAVLALLHMYIFILMMGL